MTAQLSRERLEELADFRGAPVTRQEEQAMARMLLAGMSSEPVAYIFKHPAGRLFWALTDESNKSQSDVMPVYAAPPAPVAVPDKWPEKLTWSHHDDMTQAEVLAWNNAIDACRAAMLKGDK